MRFALHLDLASQPITGHLAMAGGETREFTGYTGLIAALEGIRETAADLPVTTARHVTMERHGSREDTAGVVGKSKRIQPIPDKLP